MRPGTAYSWLLEIPLQAVANIPLNIPFSVSHAYRGPNHSDGNSKAEPCICYAACPGTEATVAVHRSFISITLLGDIHGVSAKQ